jgi:hypothetical protein
MMVGDPSVPLPTMSLSPKLDHRAAASAHVALRHVSLGREVIQGDKECVRLLVE